MFAHNVFTVTTSLSSSVPNNDNSIVTLSSDSEDELPSLSQRIGLTKTAGGHSKDCPVNGGVAEQAMSRGEKKHGDDKGSPLLTMECRVISNEVPSASCLTRPPAVSRLSNPNIATSTTAIMATAHNETVSMPMGPTNGRSMGINSNCNIITIHDDDDPPTCTSQQSQNSPVASNLTNNK